MKEYTCTICPNGCLLCYDEMNEVCTGNRCPRGARYAESEFKNPMRSLTTTVRTSLPEYPVVSVRTSKEVPKKQILLVLAEINKITVRDYLPINAIVIANVLGTGADVLTTTPMKKGN